MILPILIITLPLIFIYLINRKTKAASSFPVPPGPPGLPVIGNLHQLGSAASPHIYLWNLSRKYGPIMRMKLGSKPVIVVSSAKLAKEVLKTQDLAFCSRPEILGQKKLSYNRSDIAFSPHNEYWKEMKKVTTINLFSPGKIQSFRPIREDELLRMIKKIERCRGQAVNLNELAMGLTSTLICRIAFGKRYEEQGSEQRRFDQLLRELRALLTTVFVADFFPSFSWVDKLNGSIKRLDTTFKKLDAFYQELIDEHLDPKWVKKMEENNILDILIQLKEEKSYPINLKWENIKALLMDIFFGGTDSSAASIVWIMTNLMKEPEVMKKVQAEVRNLVGKKGEVDEDELPKLTYLKAVMSETFRLYPPVPVLVPRETTQKCLLEGYQISPQTIVYVNTWAVARDPEYWKNPHEFSPDRFLNAQIDIKGQDFGVLPFGSGRRICPGMFMGLANVELAVANLVYHFDWELPMGVQPHDIDTDVLPGLIMHKKNPLVLVPKKYVA